MMFFTYSCRRADYQFGSAELKHSTPSKTGRGNYMDSTIPSTSEPLT
jgi:hypothetical protein